MFQLMKKYFLLFLFTAIAMVAYPQAAIVPGDIIVMTRTGESANRIAAAAFRLRTIRRF